MKKATSILLTALFIIVAISFSTCKYAKVAPDYNEYPDVIGKIFFTKCATPGCHTDASKGAAAGLSMESWNKLFEGGTGGACVIPYRSDFSTLFYYINTFSDMGLTLSPTMPYNKESLTRDEVTLIKNWINDGAPDRNGFVKFSDNPNRKKFYVTNQGTQEVAVFDMETLLQMRYINVDESPPSEVAHNIKLSPDGKYWYVASWGGSVLKKFLTSDNSFVGESSLGNHIWNTITISNDGQKGYVVDTKSNGIVAEVDLNSLSPAIYHTDGYNNPHGSCLNPAGDTLYLTSQNSSVMYKVPLNPGNEFDHVPPVNLYKTLPPSSLNSHEVLFSPDGTKYFVTCQSTTNPEVRVFKAKTDSLMAVIPVGMAPSEMAVSAKYNYLFVSCEADQTSFPGKTGSIAVINMTNYSLQTIYAGHQPHGIGLDDSKGMVFVACRNQTVGGPLSHHPSTTGKNGYITFIDMSTLTLVQQPGSTTEKRIEVSVDPYSIAVRH
jgi:DNA-binding beta-propeller fold protein YncE